MEEDLPFEELGPPRARITVGPSLGLPSDDMLPPGVGTEPGPLSLPEPEIPTSAIPDSVEDGGDDPFERAAERTRKSVRERKEQDYSETWSKAVNAFIGSASEAPRKAIQGIDESFSGHYVPEGAVFQDAGGAYIDKDGNPLPVTRKPYVLPITRNAETGSLEGAMPGFLDVLATPGGTSGRTASLTSGFRISGMGHNQGPPLPPGAAPAPMAPPPPAGPGRQIIHGHQDNDPVTFDSVYTQVFDDLHPLKVLQKEIGESGAPITPDEKFYELARLTRGSYGRTEQAMKNSTFDFKTLANNGAPLKEVLKPVSNNLKEFEEFEEFAVAARDLELSGRGIQTGADIAAAQARVAAASPEFRAALNGLHGYQDRVLQYAVDSGIIGQESAANMRAANRHYVPFQRFMENSKEISGGRNLRPSSPVKQIKGSERDILSPIETIIRNTHFFIDLAEKNRAMQALEDAAMSRGLTDILKPVGRGRHPVHVTKDEVERFLQNSHVPVPAQLYGAPDQFSIFRPNAFNPKPNEIVVYRDGKPHVYEVDKDIAKAINGMNAPQVSDVMRLAALPTQALRAGAVLGPELLLKNPLRDQFSAAVLSKNGYLPFYSYVKGLGHYIGNTQKYQNWLKSGGANAALTSMDRRYIEEYINTLTKSGLFPKPSSFVNPRFYLDQLSKMAEIGEQPSRIADYVSATAPGPLRSARGVQPKTMHEGAYDSREVTLDFQRRGSAELILMLGRTAEFFNPTIQGTDRLARAFKDDPAATSVKMAAYIVAPTMLAYALNRSDPRMREVPRHERDTYWHVPIEKWRPITAAYAATIPDAWKRQNDGIWEMNVGEIARYPKPFEIGIMFGSSIERALDAYFHDHPEDWSGFLKSVINSTVPGMVPTVLRVPGEMAMNNSHFRERPIVSKRIESPKDRRHEHYPYTTETAKYLAGVTGALFPESAMASPAMIEYLVNGWGGSLGSYALKASDKILQAGGRLAGKEDKRGEAPEGTLADVPALKALFTRMPSTGAASVQDFYKNMNAADGTLRTIKRLERSDEPESAASLRANEVTTRFANTSRAISAQYRLIEEVRRNPKMTAREKRVFSDKAALTIIMMAKSANDRYYEAQKQLRERKAAGQ